MVSLSSFFADRDVLNELNEILRGRPPNWEQLEDLCRQLAGSVSSLDALAVIRSLSAFEAAFITTLEGVPQLVGLTALPELRRSRHPALEPSIMQDLLSVLRAAPLDSGAIHAGRITARNVVSGQQIIVNIKHQAAVEAPRADDKRMRDVLRPYLEKVLLSCSRLGFGDPTRSTIDAAALGSMALDRVWTPLRVVDVPEAGGADSQPDHRSGPLAGEDDERFITEVAEASGTLLVLGGPGSGKSTTFTYLAWCCARNWLQESDSEMGPPPPVPIRVLLRDVMLSHGEPKTDDIWTGVAELGALRRDGGRDVKVIKEFLLRCLIEGQAMLCLDGLDEVREEILPAIRALIAILSDTWMRARIVISCRTYDYMASVPNRRISVNRTVRLLPFRTEDADAYITKWHTEAVRVGRFSKDAAEQQQRSLLDSLQMAPALQDLAATPLLLALLTMVHSEEGALPDSRAIMCHRAVRYMLAESASWQGRAGSTVATSEMMDLALHVAFVAQSQLEKLGREFRGLTRKELLSIVSNYFRLDDQPPLGKQFQAVNEKVIHHLNRLIQSNGLLIDQGQGIYAFVHRSLQEFLAGQYFSRGSHHEEALRAAQDPNWRESFRLMAGYGAREGGAFYYLIVFIDDLQRAQRGEGIPPFKPTDVILAGEMLLEIGRSTLVNNGYERVMRESGLTAGHYGLWPRVANRILETVESVPPVLSAAERVRGALALAGLGDPRLVTSEGTLRGLTERMVVLPAGSFAIGSPVGVGEGDERPQRRFRFRPFAMAQHLVTNREFSDFLEYHNGGRQGGYQDITFWESSEAKRWISGDADFLRELERTWIMTVRTYHAKELRDGEIREEQLVSEARIRCATRREPFYWRSPRFSRANQPVVGVNWWEAKAYAAWLTNVGHRAGWLEPRELLRLPTEFEWERACRDRDDGRTYPWGEVWDDDRAHTRADGLELSEATPIGCYPHGTWPGGPMDLCGNVWEWLEDRKLPYGEEYDSTRYEPGSLEERAIRGSSWYNTAAFARCSARFVDRPFNLYYDVGFRLVRVERGAFVPPRTFDT
jgi:formylglycine-generating enzyme required for sulfatase activity